MIFFNPSSTEILKKISFGYFFKLQYFLSAVDTFKQKSGVAMGSSISASLATIFVNLMEKTTVKKYLDEGKVITHQRYAEDCLVIIFLDSKIFIQNNTLEFIKYRKKGLFTIISN